MENNRTENKEAAIFTDELTFGIKKDGTVISNIAYHKDPHVLISLFNGISSFLKCAEMHELLAFHLLMMGESMAWRAITEKRMKELEKEARNGDK